MRFKRNGRGRGGARPRNAPPREVGEQQQQQIRANKGIRDQNAGGRYTGRGGKGSGFRGGAGAYTNRNGGGRAGGGGYGNTNGYAYAYDYASSHPHRQAGFNFANDPHK